MSSTVSLSAGQNMPAPAGMLDVRLDERDGVESELVALLLQADGKVDDDSDFVFYNAPQHRSRAISLVGASLRVDLSQIPVDVQSVVVAAHRDSGQAMTGTSIVIRANDQTVTFTPLQLDGLGTAVLLEVYRRAGGWKIRAVGQGWRNGLAGLARDYGITVDDEPENPTSAAVLEPSVVDFAPSTNQTELRQDVARLMEQRAELAVEVDSLSQQLQVARQGLVETDERMLLQQVGYYQFKHPLDGVLTSKNRLDSLRAQIKEAIKRRTAVHGRSGWMVNGSLKEGETLVREFSDLMLRTYNIEADNCVRTVRAHTLNTATKRLERTREAIVKNGRTMGVFIDDGFHALRMEELQLTADHHVRVEQEKEDVRADRQRQREEARAQEEFRRQRKDLLKEQGHYQGLLERSQRNGDAAGIAEARERLAEIAEDLEDVEEMAANTRVGHVYVISNIGAFGERMVKIGMTRRQDPMQRVYELGSASVPFRFDVHALVFSHDAVALETALHREFDELRVNRVNRRREFFQVGLSEVRDALLKVGRNHVVEFQELPEAPEWRQSQALRQANEQAGVRISRTA